MERDKFETIMEMYKNEILKMQRAGLPPVEERILTEENKERKEESIEENSYEAKAVEEENIKSFEEENNLYKEIYRKRNEKRIIFGERAALKGKFHLFDDEKEYQASAMFSSFSNCGSDLEREEKLIEVKAENFSVPFINLPCCLYDSEEAFGDYIKNFFSGISIWKYILKYPDSIDSALYLFSDAGTPSSFYGTDYYSPVYIKREGEKLKAFRFSLAPQKRKKPFSAIDAAEKAFEDRNFLKNDLLEEAGEGKISFDVSVQTLDESDFENLPFDIFSSFCVWKETDIKKKPLGRLELFTPCNEEYFSPDRIPQGIFLPKDGLLHGVCKKLNEADKENLGKYIPFDEGSFLEIRERSNKKGGFSLCGERLLNMDAKEKIRLSENIAESLNDLSGDDLEKTLLLLSRLSDDFGKMVTEKAEA